MAGPGLRLRAWPGHQAKRCEGEKKLGVGGKGRTAWQRESGLVLHPAAPCAPLRPVRGAITRRGDPVSVLAKETAMRDSLAGGC